jgi:tRNA dimethylallyltransferase
LLASLAGGAQLRYLWGMSDARPILIAGPTAGGKSAIAARLARELGGIAINADSMQVYRDLRILTARPSADEEARVPHALYGFVDGSDAYSAGRFAADAVAALNEARERGLRPIIVGGTGLYFKTLLDGLSPMPAVGEDVRARWRGEAAAAAPGELHAKLRDRDPRMAERLAPGDTQRIVRALEVLEASGVSLLEWQQAPREPMLAAAGTVRLVVSPEREELYRRIDRRFEAMVREGALEEAASLAVLRLDPALPIMNALGVRPLLRHVSGQLDLEQAVAEAQTETRQYAKRQLTWARGNMIAWKWLSEQEKEYTNADFIAFIDR